MNMSDTSIECPKCRENFDLLFSMCEVKCEELKSEIYEDVGE